MYKHTYSIVPMLPGQKRKLDLGTAGCDARQSSCTRCSTSSALEPLLPPTYIVALFPVFRWSFSALLTVPQRCCPLLTGQPPCNRPEPIHTRTVLTPKSIMRSLRCARSSQNANKLEVAETPSCLAASGLGGRPRGGAFLDSPSTECCCGTVAFRSLCMRRDDAH